MQELSELKSGVQQYMDEDEFLENQKNCFNPKHKSTNDVFWKCEDWMKDAMKHSVLAEECDKGVMHTDGRSTSLKTTT